MGCFATAEEWVAKLVARLLAKAAPPIGSHPDNPQMGGIRKS